MDARLDDGKPLSLMRPDPYALIATFQRNRVLFCLVASGVFLVALMVAMLGAPKYTGTAGILIEPRKQTVIGFQDVLSGLPSSDSNAVDTEVEILKSRALAKRVVATLHLDRDEEFNPDLKSPGPLSRLRGGVKAVLGAFTGSGRSGSGVAGPGQGGVVDAVMKRLKVRRPGSTYLMQVSFQSRDPVKAARIANTFADLYLLEQLEAKFEATRNASAWLNSRLADLRKQVEESGAAVEQYKAAHGLLSAQGSDLTEQQIASLNQQLAQAKVQLVESEARLSTARRQIAHGSNGENLSAALGSETISRLRQRLAEVSSNLAQLQSQYGPRYPDVLKAKDQLNDINGQIQAETNRIVSGLEAEAQVQRQRAASLAGSLAALRGTLVEKDRAAVRLRELERNAESVRSLYEAFLTRFKQTSAERGIEQADARVVSRAEPPARPSSPKLPLSAALGLVLGLGAGVCAIVVREAFATGVTTSEEMETALGLPSLAGIPTLASTLGKNDPDANSAPAQYAVAKPLSGFVGAFRNLRTSLLLSRADASAKVIAITSSLPDEGKTTTAICLARTMALAGDKVLVIDCDLRKRALCKFLNAEPEIGLIEVLAGAAELEEAIRLDALTGAAILPLAKSAETTKDVLGGPAMDRLLAEARTQYDVVILDTAPVLPVAETRALAAKADVVALLVRWRKTPRKAAASSIKLLQQAGDIYIAGSALTLIDAREHARYGYGDPGYYVRADSRAYVSLGSR